MEEENSRKSSRLRKDTYVVEKSDPEKKEVKRRGKMSKKAEGDTKAQEVDSTATMAGKKPPKKRAGVNGIDTEEVKEIDDNVKVKIEENGCDVKDVDTNVKERKNMKTKLTGKKQVKTDKVRSDTEDSAVEDSKVNGGQKPRGKRGGKSEERSPWEEDKATTAKATKRTKEKLVEVKTEPSGRDAVEQLSEGSHGCSPVKQRRGQQVTAENVKVTSPKGKVEKVETDTEPSGRDAVEQPSEGSQGCSPVKRRRGQQVTAEDVKVMNPKGKVKKVETDTEPSGRDAVEQPSEGAQGCSPVKRRRGKQVTAEDVKVMSPKGKVEKGETDTESSGRDAVEQPSEGAQGSSPVKRRRGKQVTAENVKVTSRKGKVEKMETDAQGSQKDNSNTEQTVKRGRPKQVEVKTTSSPQKTEAIETESAVEKKRRGRQRNTEAARDGDKQTSSKGKEKQTVAKWPGTSKWEENATKFKWAKSAKEKFLGGHVSISGGLYKAVLEAEEMGARAFGLFLRSQRQWVSKPLEDKDAQKFRETCSEYGFHPDMIVPHGSYLMNCGSPDSEILQKSRDLLVEELQRCQKLGLTRFNFHPGSSCGKISVEECLERIGESINQALKKTKGVTVVIENMCCQGNTVGGKFEELKEIINRIHDKTRIGICLDTCHMFAAGYDISTEKGFDNMMEEFDCIVGLPYLKAIHLNDSKGKVGNNLDRHENIGKGQIGMKSFQWIMNDPRLNGIPMILETPCPNDDTYEKEVKLLYSLCK